MSIPGLPALLPAAESLFSTILSLSADAIAGSGGTQSQWGIFLNGNPVIQADNVMSVEFRQDFTISNYPIEAGAFASYNKVQHPIEVKVSYSMGGSNADRQSFLASIAAVISDTNMYDLVTPEVTISNLNFTHQDYRINAGNAGLRVVDVFLEEVRPATLATSDSGAQTTVTGADGTTTATSASSPSGSTLTSTSDTSQLYSGIGTPQDPGASTQVNGGNVQSQTPTAAENTQFTSALTAAGNPF